MNSLTTHTLPHELLGADRNPKFTNTVVTHLSRRLTLALSVLVAAAFLLLSPASVSAQVETILHSFGDGSVLNDGIAPGASLIQASNGNFYGTTEQGGSADHGTVFEITPSGTEATLHSFGDGSVSNDGELPLAGLIQGSDGNFYGTTKYGGTGLGGGDGTVFKMTPLGAVTILHSFYSLDGFVPNDGLWPAAGLIQATDGNFYGTTSAGGLAGQGTVFEITPSGTETILYSFGDGSVTNDGISPEAGLIQGSDGNFYGTTLSGGAGYALNGSGGGTVFEVTPSGTETILHSFADGSVPNDGQVPLAGLIQGSAGGLYGTTSGGGSADLGTVFEITPSGTETILHSFGDGSVPYDGGVPLAGLIQATDGNLYGTTEYGGWGYGTVFAITPAGDITILYSFFSLSYGPFPDDGELPEAGLVQATDGNFYGTTFFGGSTGTYSRGSGYGAIFKVSASGNAPAVLSSLTLSPTHVSGGTSSTATVTLTLPAPPAGFVVKIKSLETGVATVPSATITVPGGSATATFTINSLAVGQASAATILASAKGVTKTRILTVEPPAVQSVAVKPVSVVGGAASTGTVTLAAVNTVDTIVTLADKNAAVSVPSTVTVPAGSMTATFPIGTSPVAATAITALRASSGGVRKTATLTVRAPAVSAVSLKPVSVVGGASSSGIVTLSGTAAVAVTVTLSSNNPAATVPASVTVSAGQSTATFTVATTAVSTTAIAAIQASGGGTKRTVNLTIRP